MYFCPKCHFSFDIGKSSNVTVSEKNILKRTVDIFKKIENNENLSKYSTDITLEEITKNIKYKKLSDEDKNNINKLYEDIPSSGIEFKCNNCNNTIEIQESILLYELDLNNKNENIKTLEENELYCNNPILPRTHDYICKNEFCETNKNPKINLFISVIDVD
jgi:hypothetical protein